MTASVRAVPVPQLFTAATEIVPAEFPATTEIEVVVDAPDHPEGRVHT